MRKSTAKGKERPKFLQSVKETRGVRKWKRKQLLTRCSKGNDVPVEHHKTRFEPGSEKKILTLIFQLLKLFL